MLRVAARTATSSNTADLPDPGPPPRYEEAPRVLTLLLFVVQGYCEGHSTQDFFLAWAPVPPHVLWAVDGLPLLLVHVILHVVPAVPHAAKQEHARLLPAPDILAYSEVLLHTMVLLYYSKKRH